jgi:peptidyl-prolyl cis-trans isomerase B (cyclophilin B)
MGVFFSCNSQNTKESFMTSPIITLRTSLGDIKIELFEKEAPETVKNFLAYVDEKYYNGTTFHRVIDGFMIQGGGYQKEMKEKKPAHKPISNEAQHKISNQRGTIAMARTSEVHSATSQFFINVANNEFLDFRSATPSGYGYCVFGKVISGMDVVDKIKTVQTGNSKGHANVPLTSVEIIEIIKN